MAEQITIPLFPLNIVLFPGQVLHLYIFEERYKRMVADCRPRHPGEAYRPFGICLGPDDSMQQVGCTAQIREILKEYEDGRMDLVVVGLQRYRLLQTYVDRPYLQGLVELLQDEEELPDESLVQRAEQGFERLMDLAESQEKVEPSREEGRYAFALGQLAGLNAEERQQLLELPGENQRLARLVDIFEELFPRLEQKRARQQKVRSNGHFKKL